MLYSRHIKSISPSCAKVKNDWSCTSTFQTFLCCGGERILHLSLLLNLKSEISELLTASDGFFNAQKPEESRM
jgi:hypothetical protein